MNECGTDEAVSVPKKKNRIEVDEANFQPFDYSKTDSSFFKGLRRYI